MAQYNVLLRAGGEGYFTINVTILAQDGTPLVVATFDCGGLGDPSLSAQGTIDWNVGAPTDFIGQKMSITTQEVATSLWVQFYQGVAPNESEVGSGRLQSSLTIGTQGGTGTFQAPT